MRYISEEELRKWIITKGCDEGCGYIDERDLNDMEWMEFEDGDKVKRQVYEQVMWERDVAIGQLKELGYEFGEKIRTDGDTISRQAVLDLAKKGVLISNGNYKSVCKAINEIPSVNPTKTGHWIPIQETFGVDKEGNEMSATVGYLCSECAGRYRAKSYYCPHCGARMVEPQERSNKE